MSHATTTDSAKNAALRTLERLFDAAMAASEDAKRAGRFADCLAYLDRATAAVDAMDAICRNVNSR
jgi:hypothetical protein